MYLVIENGVLSACEGVPSLDDMNRIVGGYIELAMTDGNMQTHESIITVYCNGEGMLLNLDPNVSRWSRDGDVLRGPLVVVATSKDGDTISLTTRQAQRVVLVRDDNRPLVAVKMQDFEAAKAHGGGYVKGYRCPTLTILPE
jgi:hypothetical protein